MAGRPPGVKITERQKAFCMYVVQGKSRVESIRLAGYSHNYAENQAVNVLAKPHVKAYIKELTEKMEFNTAVTAQRVLDELARIAFMDIGTFYKKVMMTKGPHKGTERLMLKSLDEMTVHQRAAISEYDPETGAIKLYNKDPALDKLGRHLKLFTNLDPTVTNFTFMPVVSLNGKEVVFDVGEPAPIPTQQKELSK